MARSSHHLRAAALVAGAGVVAACSTDSDSEAPEIVEIQLRDVDTIRLTFSEPVCCSVVDVSAFRLSAAIVLGNVTRYYAMDATDEDLAELGGDSGDVGPGDGGTSDGGGSAGDGDTIGIADDAALGLIAGRRPRAVFDVAIESIARPNDLYGMPIASALDVDFFASLADTPGCERLRGIPASEGGLVLHYRPLGDDVITDPAGNPVAPFSPAWVAKEADATLDAPGVLPLLGDLPPMQCP